MREHLPVLPPFLRDSRHLVPFDGPVTTSYNPDSHSSDSPREKEWHVIQKCAEDFFMQMSHVFPSHLKIFRNFIVEVMNRVQDLQDLRMFSLEIRVLGLTGQS